MGEAARVAVMPPGAELTVYEVIAEPPFERGAANVTSACVLPAAAIGSVGAPGRVAGVTLFEGADASPVPTALVAVTVNVYAVPLVSPLTMMGEAVPPALLPPGEDVTVYEVMGEPPFEPGGVNVTVACALPAVAVP